MRQEYKYTVQPIGTTDKSILNQVDDNLVGSYSIGIQSFNPNESRLDVELRNEDGDVLDYYQDVLDYTVRGVAQGSTRINQLEVDPTIYLEGITLLGKAVVSYRAYNNLYSRGATLYIYNISSDRTELQLKAANISLRELQRYTTDLQARFEDRSYFSEAILEVGNVRVPIINAITEVVGVETVATIKLYEALPEEIQLKDTCQVLESLGGSVDFLIGREVTVIEDPKPELRGPNFAVKVESSTTVTDYQNYKELLSQKSNESSKELYSLFKQAALHTSIDYENFSDFIHFSSAVERLENARYKFEQIFEYQEERKQSTNRDEQQKIDKLIAGIVDNFDHYENYLYTESGSKSWPKKIDPDLGIVRRPFECVDHYHDQVIGYTEDETPIVEPGYGSWYEEILEEAEGYDNNNKDILTSTIPAAIREDLDHNEPYLIFILMIGQHFDDLWIYAKALADRYKADNRLNFGISKELVRDALEAFGLNLYESNQNLNGLFELCKPDGTYDPGLETAVKTFKAVRGTYDVESDEYTLLNPTVDQPTIANNYSKQVYKRIYHNIPTLLKTKGTSRGLRVLLNCFGIPNDILTFKVQGGVNPQDRPFFGPEDTVTVSPEYEEVLDEACTPLSKKMVSGSVDKIRIKPADSVIEFKTVDGTGSFYSGSVLSRYTPTTRSTQDLTDDSHKVEVGFDINASINKIFRELAGDFTVDNVIGDPRNRENQYSDLWKSLREELTAGVSIAERYPASIIRLVRYFDSTFFNMLKDFLPARASIDSGIIIKDNLLHRNRWRGVEASWIKMLETGSISGSVVYGSHGGSFRYAGHKLDTGDKECVSTGDRYVLKDIPSGSREINGELTGSVLTVTNGELTADNDDRKAGQPINQFDYNVWFLGLPDLPLCTSKLQQSGSTNYWCFEVRGTSSFGFLSGEELTFQQSEKYHVFDPENNYEAGVQTHWPSGRVQPPIGGNWVFFGWYSNSGSISLGHPWTPGSCLSLTENEVEGPNYSWVAEYRTGSRQIFWTCIIDPGSSQYSYYGPQDLIVAWKYLPESQDPRTDRSVQTPYVALGRSVIALGTSDNQNYSITVPDSVWFGSTEGYYWVTAHLPISASRVDKFLGMEKIGGYSGPFMTQGIIVDAQWSGSYGEWPYYTWPILTGSI